jgi:hypothetical protein
MAGVTEATINKLAQETNLLLKANKNAIAAATTAIQGLGSSALTQPQVQGWITTAKSEVTSSVLGLAGADADTLGELKALIDGNKSGDESLAMLVTTIGGKVTALEGLMTTLTGRVAALEAELAAVNAIDYSLVVKAGL